MEKQRSFDFFGSVALVKFPREYSLKEKKKFAQNILVNNKSIKTVLEKSDRFKGRLRKMQTNYLVGEKTKEVLYKENGCVFRFNIDSTYFSPRLANERKEIASLIKKKDSVLVLFAGVAPFSISIAKMAFPKRIVSNELNREANKYAKLNLQLNKVEDQIELMAGDAKKVCSKLAEKNEKFDVIVMPRPQLKDSFIEDVLKVAKKGTRIYYYDFCKLDEIESIVNKVKSEAEKVGRKIKLIQTKNAGELAPYKIRLRVDFIVMD
jgi:tRNA (guanine37-N1)-methyltransferase